MTVRTCHEKGARRSGALLAFLLTTTVLTAWACSNEAAELVEPPIPLTATVDSPHTLGRAVLNALRGEDRDRLAALALSEAEFRDLVWPELPSSRPEMGLPLEYAWRELRQKSADYLQATLAGFGGRRFELIDVRFLGDTTDYGSFRVHRDSVLEVRTESGEAKQIRVFGSMIEYDGRVKVFSYVVE